ncbi:uncharacterized protein LOC119783913 isoform X1 [Cyprinodon tularosa]|uniref:uncharacterized protein LOC119783913 isoform X1 n=1 Tax=Cyprinodon tularosa TaxID=77115 RepID=UPI0018E21DB9|nr:uncharacterized protein LOC119783913 isoform X1 [Cyprinodon tularosa]
MRASLQPQLYTLSHPQHHIHIRVCPVLRFLQAIHRGIVVWEPLIASRDLLNQVKILVMRALHHHTCSIVCPVLMFLQAIHRGIVVWEPLIAGPDLLVCLNNSFKLVTYVTLKGPDSHTFVTYRYFTVKSNRTHSTPVKAVSKNHARGEEEGVQSILVQQVFMA